MKLEKALNKIKKIIPKKVFGFFQPMYHFGLAFVGEQIYWFPGSKIRVIGITGTNGKSTTANLVVAMLEEAGYKVGLSSTTGFQIGDNKWENLIDKTTTGRFGTFKLLRQMVREKCDYAVIEVSSHGIAQFRTWGIPFDVAVLTNITHDHLDFHGTFENYVNTKVKLFKNVASGKRKKLRFPSENRITKDHFDRFDRLTAGKTQGKQNNKKTTVKKYIILNQDDAQYGKFNKNRADQNLSYSIKNKRASVLAKNIDIQEGGASFDLVSIGGSERFALKLTGTFNVYNALSAISVGISQGIPLRTIKNSLEKVTRIPGRLEVIRGKGLNVIIDYAHTEDALVNIYETVRQFTKGSLIAVLGATGDRDRAKRPRMGQIAGKMCDVVYVTDEEPGSEDPVEIIKEIVPGVVKAGKKYKKDLFEITDREKAIKEAIKNAKPGDSIVVSGIGHQKYRMIKDVQEPWDERKIIEKALC